MDTSYVNSIDRLISQYPQSKFYLGNLRRYIDRAKDLDSTGQPLTLYFNSERGLTKDSEYPQQPIAVGDNSSWPWLVIVEGFPSPGVVNHLGSKYHVRPEALLGHLGIEGSILPRASFELPALPSHRKNIVHIHLAALARNARGKGRSSSSHQRRQAEEHFQKIEQQIFEKKQYGQARFRRLNIHNSEYFSVEQMVTFTVSNSPNRRTYVLLLDNGVYPPGKEEQPWTTFNRTSVPSWLPIVYYNQGNMTVGGNKEDQDTHPVFPIYHPEKDGFPQDVRLWNEHPFFLLAHVLRTALLSWSKVLNFIESIYSSYELDTAQGPFAAKVSLEAIEDIRANTEILQRIQRHLKNNILAIQQQQYSRECSPQPPHEALDSKIRSIALELTNDHEYLIQRCHNLAEDCKATAAVFLQLISTLEAKQSMEQSEQVAKLTKLAYMFIPLSFVASVFGMNVQEILVGQPPVWIFLVVSVAMLLVCLVPLEYTRLLQLGLRKYFIGRWGRRSDRAAANATQSPSA